MKRRLSIQVFIVVLPLLTVSAAARNITFAPASTFPSGASTPTRVWVADLNGDGVPDLVVSDNFNSIAVLIGNGDGTFKTPVVYTEDFYVTGGVAIADFNGDHKLDLAVVGGDDSGNGLALFTGNGDGTFNPPAYSVTPDAGSAIVPVVGDFNGDGKADIFVGGNGNCDVLLGDGKGNFTGLPILPASGDGVAIGDFNHDGILDAATTNLVNDEVAILIGNGDGTFQSPVIISVANEPSGITAADLNNDGNLDLAVTLYSGLEVAILIGDGKGGFTLSGEYLAGYTPGSVVAADFNRDRNLDLAVSDFEGNNLTVLQGNGTGAFSSSFALNTGTGPTSVAVGDFNRDGSPDLAVVSNGENNVEILLNKAGTFVQLSSSRNPSKVGQPVTFTAAVKGSVLTTSTPTGTLTFSSGSTILGTVKLKSGLGSFTTSTLPKGSHKISASYSGDTTFNPNESGVLTQEVQ